MDPSSTILTTTSPFTPLRLPSTTTIKRRRFIVPIPRCSSSSSSPSQAPAPPPSSSPSSSGGGGVELVVDKLSPTLRLATSAVVIAGAVAVGYSLGSKFGRSRNAAVGGAVALGLAGGASAYALNAAAPQVAAVNLHNYEAAFDDPSVLKKADINGIANMCGVNKQDQEAFKAEICEIYSHYVSSVLPPVGEELKGDEADRITSFKNSIGIDDLDAANIHMEIGRKIFRQRLEVGDREAALNQLRKIFGLDKHEADTITLDVASKVYRKQLANAVSGGELEMADSKAAFLQKLCDELHFDLQKASEIHADVYRQKLQQFVADGELSEKNVAALLRLRVMLCIPQQTVESAHSDMFEKVVKEAIASGVDGYDAEIKKSVRKVAHGLLLTRETAMSITSKAVRKIFINYIKHAQAAGNRTESAKELKKMIVFNTLVVTELVEDIKGESGDASTEEPVKEGVAQTEDEELDSIQTLKKIRPNKELIAKSGKSGQTEITLKDDLPERDRADLYKTYLLFCESGEVNRVPFGAQITTKKDDSEYVFLNQVAGILGMSGKEIVEVHRGLGEQAFRRQLELTLADVKLIKPGVEQLNNLQNQEGLPQEYAQMIIKNITTTKMVAAIETAVTRGMHNINQTKEHKEASVDLDSMASENLREMLFKKTVEDIFSSGTGEFHEDEVYDKIPLDLNINKDKARCFVREMVQHRLPNSLIQAIAHLRRGNREGVVSSLNDMLACDKAVPSRPLSWKVTEELDDLYSLYFETGPNPVNLSRLQYLLGINDCTS